MRTSYGHEIEKLRFPERPLFLCAQAFKILSHGKGERDIDIAPLLLRQWRFAYIPCRDQHDEPHHANKKPIQGIWYAICMARVISWAADTHLARKNKTRVAHGAQRRAIAMAFPTATLGAVAPEASAWKWARVESEHLYIWAFDICAPTPFAHSRVR